MKLVLAARLRPVADAPCHRVRFLQTDVLRARLGSEREATQALKSEQAEAVAGSARRRPSWSLEEALGLSAHRTS